MIEIMQSVQSAILAFYIALLPFAAVMMACFGVEMRYLMKRGSLYYIIDTEIGAGE